MRKLKYIFLLLVLNSCVTASFDVERLTDEDGNIYKIEDKLDYYK